MDNRNIIVLLVIIKVIILSVISLGTSIYAIPLCCNQRFHRPIHLLTLNVCLAAFICANFWIFFFIMNTFYVNILWTERSCLAVLYLQTTLNCQVLYGLCIVSLNRLFITVYRHNALFRTKKWVGICVGAQWLLGCLLPLPTFASSLEHCFVSGLEANYQLYTLFIIAAIPTLSLFLNNSIIYLYARRSTRRVHSTDEQRSGIVVLSQRDTRLLKHMIFMFVIFFCGWVPLYIIAVVNWDGTAIPYVLHHVITILPTLSSLLDVVNLFVYNHELRRYLFRVVKNHFSDH